jgi:ABC-type uncharacterized transport system substrate-binding protein
MKFSKAIRALVSLLIAASILLLLDLGNRKTGQKKEIPKIAVFKIASRVVLDMTEDGVIEGLARNGFIEGKTCIIKRFSPEGDMATANIIAQNIISSKFDMVITISTPALQVMANANKNGNILHVFCAVTDPFVSGVGITGKEPGQHPKHLVGIGTFQPVEQAFDIARKMKPDLKKVGTVWCTSETCSEACVRKARKKCSELGIDLLEMSVESSTQVRETALSLTMRGVEALWLGGDNVVETAVDQLIEACNRAKIPLFTNNPYKVSGNTIFGLGAEYVDVGRIAGTMAAEVLKGKPTSEIAIKNMVPEKLKINPEALKNMKDKWDISSF